MTRTVVGIFCAAASLALLFRAIWLSAGGTGGMPSLLAGLGLLLIAVLTLRPGRARRSPR
jgi:glucose dehydrogenase